MDNRKQQPFGIGTNIGFLTVLKKIEGSKRGGNWEVRCVCGRRMVMSFWRISNGTYKSCGCKFSDSVIKRNTTHGLRNSPEFNVWVAMRRRCNDNKSKSWDRYGGRGIKVCDRWNRRGSGFPNFIEDMGMRPSINHSIERIDNDGDYCPSNCIWATKKDQSRNRSNTVKIMYIGELTPLSVIAEKTGINIKTLRTRVNAGWRDDEIISTPVRLLTPQPNP